MSDEIAQDDDGNFEIGDIGMPDDSDDDEEAAIGKPVHLGQDSGVTGAGPAQASSSRAAPGAQSQSTARAVPLESLDGETIFAVGDEDGDKGSDSEGHSDDDEDAKLVHKKL